MKGVTVVQSHLYCLYMMGLSIPESKPGKAVFLKS